ncbi:H-2 class I histocompatibility antigen, Q8 alpha chain-like, partial [Anguilla anguilla]|uniref:H-2 class I histocompatibility antigen, Q8 alpha chain-like n=1 Tax=Anguilla anguilla TaxID=7936 RepID=UPI0015A94CD3
MLLNLFLGTRVLALLCVVKCGICGGNAASHSLKYIYTAVTGDTDSLDFTIMGLVDDEQFVHYDSNIRRMISKTEWMEKSVDKQYWDKQTQKALYADQIFKDNIGIAMQHYKSTQGQHLLEWTVGCEWDNMTRTTRGIEHYVYDWKRFFPDAIKNWNFIPPAQQLFISAVKWNPAELENYNQTQTCIESLKKYVSYRRSTLERTVAPEVSLLQKDSSPVVTCHVTGFYPRDLMVTWQRNGEHLDVDVELGETVPNEDGTFQTTSNLTVKPEDWKSQNYTCTVQHKSLKQDIILPVKEENIKIAPEVSLLQKDPSSPGVTCHVTGFYPRDITITWQRNGEDLDVGVELEETVSNENRTFQTTSNLTVKPEDWKSQNYTCTVQHKSLKQDIVLPVKEENIKIAPEVSLLQKDSSSPGVTCHVTGFYPRDIMVTWQRNGEDLDVEPGEMVRNGDGTFQTTSSLTVKPEDWKSQNYTCTVQHKSLKQDIVLPVKEENIKRNTDIKMHFPEGSSPPMGVIIGCVVGALILAVIGA